MEVVASGFAVASLAIQLLDSTSKIRKFVHSVKGAPQERLRVVNLLDRLSGLFQSVATTLQQQASLSDHRFPAPDAIARCLQSCEERLEPLQKMADKHMKLQASSRLGRLQTAVRATLKADDLRDLELRLHQEITSLVAALEINNTSIVLYIYTVLRPEPSAHTKPLLAGPRALQAICDGGSTLDPKDHRTTTRRVSTSSNVLFIRSIRSQRILPGHPSSNRRSGCDYNRTLMEEYEYFISLPFVRYGISMCQQTRFGPIFPALRVCPIVDDIDSLWPGGVQKFQMAIETGSIHPYTRDRLNRSLLHFAAEWRRPDWYRLLLELGVKPESGVRYGGVWEDVTEGWVTCNGLDSIPSCTIDTYRLLWEGYEERPEILEMIGSGRAHLTRQGQWESEAKWLFQESPNHLSGSELANFRSAILRGTFVNFIWDSNSKGLQWLKETLYTPAGAQLFEDIGNGNFNLLETFFGDARLMQPLDIGAVIISALSLLGVDIEACVKQELLQSPLGMVKPRCCSRRLKTKVTFVEHDASGYSLNWDWIYDKSAPGYLLVSEFSAFSVDSVMNLHDDDDPVHAIGPLRANRHDRAKYSWRQSGEEKWPPRFKRRAAKKERKERARLGQKTTHTQMPGSWVP